jgi:hypothetical protein
MAARQVGWLVRPATTHRSNSAGHSITDGFPLRGEPILRNFGTPVNDQSLTPGPNPRRGPTRFAEWLTRAES